MGMSPPTPAADLTIAELASVLGDVLGTGYDGVRNGRVRDLPDARTIRWYQTLGVVDRPAAFRGRTALYGRRHVLQLAAIKKLQASAMPLADIQRAIAGRTDAELAGACGLAPAEVDRFVRRTASARSRAEAARLLPVATDTSRTSRRDTAFWSGPPADAAGPGVPAASSPAVLQPAGGRPLQSLAIGGTAALVWNGRPLTPAETATLARISRPIVRFLSSSAAGGVAEPPGRGLPPSARRRRGTHP